MRERERPREINIEKNRSVTICLTLKSYNVISFHPCWKDIIPFPLVCSQCHFFHGICFAVEYIYLFFIWHARARDNKLKRFSMQNSNNHGIPSINCGLRNFVYAKRKKNRIYKYNQNMHTYNIYIYLNIRVETQQMNASSIQTKKNPSHTCGNLNNSMTKNV